MLEDGKGAVLDIGANLGIMTVHLSNHLPTAKIYAFEPMPDNRAVFHKVIETFDLQNVQLYECALGNEKGKIEMILPMEKGAKMQGLSHVKHESITEWNEGEEYEVPIEVLDELSFEESIQGIKMDVENYEYFVLQGGKALIEKNKPIIYTELWENENRENCLRFLEKMGYTANVVVNGSLQSFDPKKHRCQNFIFIAN